MAASAVQFAPVGAKPQFGKQFHLRRSLPCSCSIDVSEDALQKEFHEMFRMPAEKKKMDKKNKKKAKNLKEKGKLKSKITDVQPWRAPVLEIRGNPSPFAVFTNVRQCILVKHLRDSACYFYWASLNPHRTSMDSDSDTEVEGGGDGASDEGPRSVPKMVGIGLCSMFELIRESRTTQPALCLAVLRSLLDVLQGQQPEGFRTEPTDVVDKMYDLLLDLATVTQPVESDPRSSEAPHLTSQLTSYACACLLSLVVARGETAKILGATASLLTCSRSLTTGEIPTPNILIALQKSVQAVLLGKTWRPDWLTHGVPWAAHCETFSLKIPKLPGTSKSASSILLPQCFIALDGKFLYVLRQGILHKFGSGFGGTVKGELIQSQPVDGAGWIGFVRGYLYVPRPSAQDCEFLKIDRETLKVKDVVSLPTETGQNAYFSDGESLGLITSSKDDSFVIRTYKPSSSGASCMTELNLKLARKCVEVFGSGMFTEDSGNRMLNMGTDDDPVSISCGKDFALARTASGKVLYTGKAQSLGIKQGGPSFGKWSELPITKSPRMVDCSVGHDGLHALLVAEDGSVYFVGLARRGEDGDQGKARRQPKATKPKKMFKLEGQCVVQSACNNGTSALVTRDGELYIYGKDSTHAEHGTGLMTDLKELTVTQVALGKAHAIAVTAEGHAYTFGINHKGQCGRDFAHSGAKEAAPLPLALALSAASNAGGTSSGVGAGEEEDEELESEDPEVVCPPGKHRWKHNLCMVCTVCGDCTGYGPSCIASGRPDRNPGQPCGCGVGDSGCEECGCCRSCAREEDYEAEVAAAWASPGDAAGAAPPPAVLDNKQTDIIIFDVRFGGRAGARLEDKLRRRIEEYRTHHRRKQVIALKTVKGAGGVALPGSVLPLPFGGALGSDLPDKSASGTLITDDSVGSDQEREASKLTSLPPARLCLPCDSSVVLASCGMHHTVLLLQNGQVYTFGSNQHGQLGHGDLLLRGTPTLVLMPLVVTQVAAGSNHTVLLTASGQVYTCGNYQKGQLGRGPGVEDGRRRGSRDGGPWHASPGPVPGIEVKQGRRATWVGASGDHTFVKLDEFLTSSSNLAQCSVVANRNCVGVIPKDTEQVSKFKCLMINKADGTCRSFNSADQIDFKNHATCFDSVHNILWSLNQRTHEVSYYSVIASEAVPLSTSLEGLEPHPYNLPSPLGPELCIPGVAGHPVGRSQAALYLLAGLDVLTAAQERGLKVKGEEQVRHQGLSRTYAREDFSAVNRFESHGGGWGYSGHSIEAIRFMADSDILLGGFGLFGGRGEYTAKLRLFDIGIEGGDQETDGELLAETEEMPYECGARHKYPMLFDEPVPLQANRWYVAWARISGPSSDCGSSGQSVVITEDQVVFYFKSSKKSNNGTDVNAGQLPQLLYRVIAPDVQASIRPLEHYEPVLVVSNRFSKTVTPECFQSLLQLLHRSWQSFKGGLCDVLEGSPDRASVLDLGRLLYICAASLHLLRIYINEVYPASPYSKKSTPESPQVAECVADARTLLQRILSDRVATSSGDVPLPNGGSDWSRGVPGDDLASSLVETCLAMQATLLEECDMAFMSCYHAFYPSTTLKWRGLCSLLLSVSGPWSPDAGESDRLLAAVLASLCSPVVRLVSLLPPCLDRDFRSSNECTPGGGTSSPSPDTPASSGGDILPPDLATLQDFVPDSSYPILVETMNRRTEKEGCHLGPCSFREVLERLMGIVVGPVCSILKDEPQRYTTKLVSSTCAFLSAVVAELSSQTIGCVVDVQRATRQALHCTPSRFTRVSQNRTWNTGNGSPDAICFSVDRSSILLAGVCIYGGVGNEWHYELELLDDSGSGGDPSHTQRWKTVDVTRGTFSPDDCYGDVAEIKFDRPIPIKENVKYALRLRNHGARTNNGDGGLTQVKGPDGTTFTFSDCSLSFNGTNHTRGQIPQILYYSTPLDTESQQASRDLAELQARRNALSICSTIVKASAQLLMEAATKEDDGVAQGIGSSLLMTRLLPMVLAHLCPMGSTDARSAVEVLDMVQKLLRWAAVLNRRNRAGDREAVGDAASDGSEPVHYAVVESDHPYKAATVSVYKVKFPQRVRWMALEFDPRCSTAQAEDCLQLYITNRHKSQRPSATAEERSEEEDDDSSPYWPVLRKFGGSADWPTTAIVLPGNEVAFSLETASDYVKDEKSSNYGFRCQVTGYEGTAGVGPSSSSCPSEGLKHLEKELAYLGGMCAASLLRRDLVLPAVSPGEMEEDLDLVDYLAHQVFESHSALLSRGFALAHPPTIQQALEGVLPFSDRSNERPFLKDFVACNPGTSGGRLARWLQPESYVDPKQCELVCSQEELKCGWPSVITVVTKDQYSKVVRVPNMKVEVRAVPMNTYNKDSVSSPCRKSSHTGKGKGGCLTFGGRPAPSLDVPYEVTIKDKMLYYAITVMKAYEEYSFEELRFVSPTKKRLIETMLVRANNDGTYTANWTPGSVGWYLLHATIDGFEIGSSQCHLVEVKEPPHGLVIPSKNLSQKMSHQPNKTRKFFAKFSAGLRIRSHPSLQSKQIGVIHVNGTVTFIDELHNDDGVWVRLNPETIKTYCQNGYSEAWCLQYNQHIGKTLLIPIEEPKSVLEEFFSDKVVHKKKEEAKPIRRGPGVYHVVRCGASGHNIRSKPNLKAPPVGMLVLGNTVTAVEDVSNADGVWLRLSRECMQRYCFSNDGEAWSLARSASAAEVIYLRHESEVMQSDESDEDGVRGTLRSRAHRGSEDGISAVAGQSKGYDFASLAPVSAVQSSLLPGGQGNNQSIFTFGSGTSDQEGGSSGSTSPFVFGSPASTPSTSTNVPADSDRTKPSGQSDPFASNGSAAASPHRSASSRARWHGHVGGSPPRVSASPPRPIPPELRGVSVRELVRAIGESRANGNAATPPHTPPNTPPVRRRGSSASVEMAQSSSPVPIPGSSPVPSSCSDSLMERSELNDSMATTLGSGAALRDNWSEASGYSRMSSSPRRASLQSEGSVSSHLGSFFRELRDTSTTGCIGCITQRTTDSPISTPGTPKKECLSPNPSSKSFAQTGTQTSPESGIRGHFSIGSGGSREDISRVSPKLSRRGAASSGRHPLRTKRDRPHSPADTTHRSAPPETVQEATSPSVAECVRAVFAAFLWHEGVVHDAMACASFLKFNPDLPKIGERRVTTMTATPMPLTKEQKARFRHSVEVTSPSLLHLQKLELLPQREQLNENVKRTFVSTEGTCNGAASAARIGAGGTTDELPRSLQLLVVLWERISGSCTTAIGQQLVLPSPLASGKTFQRLERARGLERRRTKKKREFRSSVLASRAVRTIEANGGETTCELCGTPCPHPVTYHMRQAHPGCGDHAGGKGYNSAGTFCGGWAGNCGDGGVASSSWYLVCDRCREKFLRQKQQKNPQQRPTAVGHRRSVAATATRLLSPLQGDVHHNMKHNALFLLELSSSATTSRSRRSGGLPSLMERDGGATTNPFLMAGSFQCLDVLGVTKGGSQYTLGEDYLLAETGSMSTLEAEFESSVMLNGNEVMEDGAATEKSNEESAEGSGAGSRAFHRSVSVGLTQLDWMQRDAAEGAAPEAQAIVVPRKRNNSSGSEGMSSILCQPSAALTKLVSAEGNRPAVDLIMQRPVMMFVLQRHDLDSLQLAIQQALRKATCRVYAMQAFNWLLRNVTQLTPLHDLLWCLVAATSPAPPCPDRSEDDLLEPKEDLPRRKDWTELDKEATCEHPLSDLALAGEACCGPLRGSFHALLQTVSDLLVFLPAGSALQQMAMQCWRLRFLPSDHGFLHRCHVFSSISRILSHSEEAAAFLDDAPDSAGHPDGEPQAPSASIEVLKDVTAATEIKASSRQAMVNSLTDSSTETFWESGDEDRNKTKVLTLTCSNLVRPRMACVHVDNCRDLANKVSTITFKSGLNSEELRKLKQVEVESRYTGWVSCAVPDPNHGVLRLELRGPDNSLRLRQLKVLGSQPGIARGSDLPNGDCCSARIQQKNCEAETLRVFRLLTSQVFGKLLGEEVESPAKETAREGNAGSPERPDASNDLKEHMVGILFSRSKLTHLQKQVCSHIVSAIKKEASRVRDEWEASLPGSGLCGLSGGGAVPGSPTSRTAPGRENAPVDTYCFEMLSMVLALSGSAVGRAYLSQQAGLLRDLFSLLHTGSARVQRQVTSLLRRVLPEVPPPILANILQVGGLPPMDYGIAAGASTSPSGSPLDMERVGLLDILLGCVAKALQVQAKVRGGRGMSGATLASGSTRFSSRWWLRGSVSSTLAQGIIQLLRDMAGGKLTEAWAKVTKAAIAESILNFTKLDEKYRTPTECLKTPTLWLALASLCVLDQDHVERLSSGQWVRGQSSELQPQPRPTCDNHDDGETPAIISCNVCGNVCADCDRFLHLHRRTKGHQRQVFKEEEEAIKVDLHEGCGRTKLFWVMALADSRTLKAMVEFREGERGKVASAASLSATCRFCGGALSAGLLSLGNVCVDCQEHAANACSKIHACGHLCGGLRGETTCLPCLHGCGSTQGLRQDADDMCMICFSEALSCAPATQLTCGHIFHHHCCQTVLSKRWSGPRITFGFSLCPICKAPMEHEVLRNLLEPIKVLYEDVRRKALMRLEYEGLHRAEAITVPGARFYNDPAGFAMDRYAYYVCYKCKKAYYGGEVRCEVEAGPVDEYDPAELVCGACSDVSRAQMCPKHGTDFLEYKCRYCCSVAVFFCFGTTHFCNACHDDFQRVANLPKHELPRCPAGPKAKQLEGEECPLHIKHPPTGEEFALGCGVCRNAHTF